MRDKWSRRMALVTWVTMGLYAAGVALSREPVSWWMAAVLAFIVALDAFEDWYKARRPRPWERE